MSVRPLIALDLGATKVACAIGLPHEQTTGFELMGTSLVPYPTTPESWLADPALVARTIEHALDATAVSAEMDRALVSISPPSLLSEQARVTIALGDEPVTIRQRDLVRLQSAALNQVLSIDRDALLIERLGCAGNGFDGVRDPGGLPATRLTGAFHVVTIPTAVRRAAVQAVEAAGLDAQRLVYALPASLRSMVGEGMEQQRVLLLDAGGFSTNLGLFVDGALFAACILPSGGVTLAQEIAPLLHVTHDQAVIWTLEGASCSKSEVRQLIGQHWQAIGQAIRELLSDQPKPDAIMLSGRGALIDGFAEWVEKTLGMSSVLCRSPRTSRLGELARQVGLSAAIGLLEMATQAPQPFSSSKAGQLFDRLIDRTKTVLTEYF